MRKCVGQLLISQSHDLRDTPWNSASFVWQIKEVRALFKIFKYRDFRNFLGYR